MDDKERFPEYTAADHFVRKLRPIFFVGVIVSGPVTLFSYVYMLQSLYLDLPVWLFLGIFLSHLISWITLGMLVDHQQERSR